MVTTDTEQTIEAQKDFTVRPTVNSKPIALQEDIRGNIYTDEDKQKLQGIEAGAQVNKVNSVAGKTGDIVLSKEDIGLNNVDNTSDLDKPISTAQQGAFDKKVDKTSPNFNDSIRILGTAPIIYFQSTAGIGRIGNIGMDSEGRFVFSGEILQNGKTLSDILDEKANLTGENTFNGEQTIQGNVYVGGQVNIPNGPVTVQNINVADSISSLQNNVSSINNKINTNVVQNISTNVNGDNFSLIQTLINLNTQATTQQSTNIPLANSTTAGLMSSSDFASLQNLEDRVGNLEGKTTRLLYTASTNPTADDINSFVTGLGYTPPFEGVAVVVDETFHIWHYYDSSC